MKGKVTKRKKKAGRILCMAFLVFAAILLAGCRKAQKNEAEDSAAEKNRTGDSAIKENPPSRPEDNNKEDEETTQEQNPIQQPEQPSASSPAVAIPLSPNHKVVVIDPGHQLHGDSTKEPDGPGSATLKARVASGATGVATRIPEYRLNLAVSLKLKTELENRGYTVYMTRTTNDVNISNMERAQFATSVGADIAVRIHANGSGNASVRGAEVLIPSSSNPYIAHLADASRALGQCILDSYCAATGFNKRTVYGNDTMTGINWSSVPVAILEMGYLSNPDEDRLMQDEAVQSLMAQGIANGIDAYFGL